MNTETAPITLPSNLREAIIHFADPQVRNPAETDHRIRSKANTGSGESDHPIR